MFFFAVKAESVVINRVSTYVPCTQLPFGSAVSLGNTVLLVVKPKGYVFLQ